LLYPKNTETTGGERFKNQDHPRTGRKRRKAGDLERVRQEGGKRKWKRNAYNSSRVYTNAGFKQTGERHKATMLDNH